MRSSKPDGERSEETCSDTNSMYTRHSQENVVIGCYWAVMFLQTHCLPATVGLSISSDVRYMKHPCFETCPFSGGQAVNQHWNLVTSESDRQSGIRSYKKKDSSDDTIFSGEWLTPWLCVVRVYVWSERCTERPRLECVRRPLLQGSCSEVRCFGQSRSTDPFLPRLPNVAICMQSKRNRNMSQHIIGHVDVE
jgi:hypothetical protein